MLLILLVSIVGVSYSAWKYTFEGNENKIETGDVSLKLLESNKNIISLNNSLPMSDEEGIKQTETGNVFDFSVETKASFNINIGYKINIEKLSVEDGYTSLEDDQIKIYLTDENNNKIIGPVKISELDNYNLYEDMNIHTKDNNIQIDKYKIRVWIDKDVDASNWDENTKLEYKFKIGVGSSDKEGTYNISYSPNGGEGQMAPSIYNENTEELLRKNTLTRGGYTFKGWSTTSNGEVEYQEQTKATNLTTGNDKNKTLYAVWNPNTYTVKYHPNGGLIKNIQTLEPDVNYDPMNFGDTPWINENGIYKSNNQSVDATYSSLWHALETTEATTLSFEVAVSSEENDVLNIYLYDSNAEEGSDEVYSTTLNGNSDITSESDLIYEKINVDLEAGTYLFCFEYYKNSSNSGGLDRAYVKNIQISGYVEGQTEDSLFTVGQNNKLKKNEYEKKHYTFKGWDTNKNVSEPKYKDENDLTEIEKKVKEKEQIDLYAIWEKEKYTVNVVVKNGTVDTSSKQILYNEKDTFNLTTTIENAIGSVTCTNNQTGKVENNILTVSNVSANTTCTVKYTDTITTLYEDGTLIINESAKNRNTNLSTHGNITKEYDAMSDNNSYVMSSSSKQPWYSESSSIKSVEIGQKIEPISTQYWFYSLSNMEKGDFTNSDTTSVTDMDYMFSNAGQSATTFELKGLNNWDTSKVTNMSYMFDSAGESATTWSIGDLSNWNTSSVIDMSSMFSSAGESATTWSIGDLSNWDVSSVTSMSYMFYQAGYSATAFDLNLSKWDTLSVTSMSSMFNQAGYSATIFGLKGLNNWNTSSVTNMNLMFNLVGYSATTWSIGDLSNWNTSSVTNMYMMFDRAGYSATTWSIGDLSNWNTSSVTNMQDMFSQAGYSATIFDLNLSNWDASKVTDMFQMFSNAGYRATTFNLDLSSWNTSSVTNMSSMFYNAGYSSTTWTVKIPSKTGDLTNTTSKWYGSSESVYAAPATGKSFTLVD